MSNFFNYDDDKVNCAEKANFKIPKTTHFGLESIRWMVSFIWSFVLKKMKNVKYLDIFKNDIKKPSHLINKCPCKMCKKYGHGIRYLN